MNKDYQVLKREAIQLRKKGLSYNEIRKKIGVAKSTLSLWLKSVLLKPEHRERLYTKQIEILSRGAPSQRERRKKEVEKITINAKRAIKFPLSEEAYKLFGVALYWAEGSKQKNFEITNSDPHLILFMIRWFKNIFGVYPRDLRPRLNIYSQQDEAELKKFWSDLTGIPIKNFGKSYIKPPNKGYKKNNLYYGTIKVYVAKGTDMKHKVFGWVQAVIQDVEPEVKVVQKKWESLTNVCRPVNLKTK
jgi:hypothetical protein